MLTRFSPLLVYGIFFRRSRAANSAVLDRIWLKFKLVQDIMDVLVTCKYEEDPIKNEGARVLTRLYNAFSDAQGQLTPTSAAEFSQNSNSSKLLSLSSLPARMKKIQSKMKELDCSQDFPHNKSKGIFFTRLRAANSAVLGRIWLKFELVRDIIDVLVTCKYEEDQIKNERARVLTRLYDVFLDATYSEVSGGILPKFELIQAFIVVLVTVKNEENPIKNKGARVLTKFSPL